MSQPPPWNHMSHDERLEFLHQWADNLTRESMRHQENFSTRASRRSGCNEAATKDPKRREASLLKSSQVSNPCLSITLWLCASCVAGAEPTSSQFLKGQDSEGARFYISGIYTGLQWANVNAVKAGQPPIFCAPKEPLEIKQVIQILAKFVSRGRDLEELPVGIVLMTALKDAYPCR
jgi:hypothetical protein